MLHLLEGAVQYPLRKLKEEGVGGVVVPGRPHIMTTVPMVRCR